MAEKALVSSDSPQWVEATERAARAWNAFGGSDTEPVAVDPMVVLLGQSIFLANMVFEMAQPDKADLMLNEIAANAGRIIKRWREIGRGETVQ